MKKLIPCFLLLLIGCKHKEAGKPRVVCSATKLSVLYIGVNNPISVVAAGIPCDKLKLKVVDNLGTIEGDSGKYIASPKSLNYKILAYKIEDDKEIFLDTLKYKVLSLPLPTMTIAGQSGDCILSKEELLNAKGIIPALSDFVFDIKYPVFSFKMSIMDNGVWIEENQTGPAINKRMKELIQKVNSGQKVLIEEIYFLTPEGKRKGKGILIHIK